MNDDDELSRRITRLLDKSLEALDPATLAQLRNARQDALRGGRRPSWKYASLAAAAGLAAVALFPWLLREPALPDRGEHLVMIMDVDPAMLENLDLLQTLGEDADAG